MHFDREFSRVVSKQGFALTNRPAHLPSPAIFKPGMTSALYIGFYSPPLHKAH